MSNGNNGHAAADGRRIWVPDQSLTLAENHDRFLSGIELNPCILSLDETKSPPKIVVVGCTDYRIWLNGLFGLGAGRGFVQKPPGGFIIQNLQDDMSFYAALSVAAGIKEAEHIILMTHSDCAAAKIVQAYPEKGMIADDVPKAAYLRVIQSTVLKVSGDIPSFSRCFNTAAQQGHPLPAADMMAIQLGICSYNNLMNTPLYGGMNITVREMVAQDKVCVSLLHFDLGQKGDSGEYVRLPAIYRYDPAQNRHSVLKKYTGPEDRLVVPKGHCGCDLTHG